MILLKSFERYSDTHKELPNELIYCKAKNYQSNGGGVK
jgi:hypothetical protein